MCDLVFMQPQVVGGNLSETGTHTHPLFLPKYRVSGEQEERYAVLQPAGKVQQQGRKPLIRENVQVIQHIVNTPVCFRKRILD